jgi:hypothetical protein
MGDADTSSMTINAEDMISNMSKANDENNGHEDQLRNGGRFKKRRLDQIQAQISYSDDGSIMYLKTPWNKEFVGALKTSIPHQYRKWNALRKIWEVSGGYHQVAHELVDTYYEGKIESTDALPDAEMYRKLFLIPGAPKEVISAVYAALGGMYQKAKEFNKMTELVSTYGSIIEHLDGKKKS